MKKYALIICITLFLVSNFFSVSISAVFVKSVHETETYLEDSAEVEYYALIVGVEKFAGVVYPDEDKIDDSAIKWYNMLLNDTENFKEENVKIILNEQATKNNISKAITEWLDEREDENDVVLIVYEDHGWKIPIYNRDKGHAYVFTYNVTEEQRIEDKITDIEFDSYLDTLESKRVTVILDTCYSGRMIALRQQGRVILAAGGKHFFCGVDESDVLESGIFSFFLIKGFQGIADFNKDGIVTSEEAFRYAKIPTIVTSIYIQFPFVVEFNNKTMIFFFQTPTMYDRHSGSLPLIKYKDP